MTIEIHELKSWPEYYNPVIRETKRFEIRKDDRGFKVGDFLVLNEWIPEQKEYTGKKSVYVVDYILRDKPDLGLKEGYCIMSITRVKVGEHE